VSRRGLGARPFFTAWRLRWYPRLLALSFAIAIPISALGGEGSRALVGRVGGDFPAFYAAGRLLAAGRGRDLYDWQIQSEFQADLHPETEGRFLAFSYPPFVALLYWPLAFLPYRAAYLVHTALLGLALWLAVQQLRRLLPRVDRWALEGFCLAFTFLPLFRALSGAQNTTLNLLLLAAAWRALSRQRDALAGVWLGLMLFKPQFALPLLALFLLSGKVRVLPGAAALFCLFYLLSATVCGWDWFSTWWASVSVFHAVDQSVNAANSVGWLGFAQAVLGTGSPVALWAARALAISTAAALAYLWGSRRLALEPRMAVTVVGLILMQPHCMYYDGGLIVLTLAVLADRLGRRGLLPLGALWLLSFGAAVGKWIGFNPLFLVLLASGALALRELVLDARWRITRS
jgi:hypothetical protein